MHLALVLLLPGAAAQGLLPSCTKGADPCKHTCSDGTTVDLSGFKSKMPSLGYFQVNVPSQQQAYFFGACAPLPAQTLQCQGSSVTAPIAIQTFGSTPQPPSFPPSTCASIGDYNSQTCQFNGKGNFSCSYNNGDGDRSVTFYYTCSQTEFVAPTASQPDPEQVPAHYVVSFAGTEMCPGGSGVGGGSGGWQWGDTFCLVFPLVCALYLGGGYFYNYKYKELRGIEAVPQIEYWQQVPGLVKDGCQFSKEQSLIFYAWAKEKYRGSPADAGLKAALADNEDGGGSSTAYEEK